MVELIARDEARLARPRHTGPWLCDSMLPVLVHSHATHKVWPIRALAEGRGAIPWLP
jgi:hypothetical protein